MRPTQLNRIRITLMVLIMTLGAGLLAPLSRAGRIESIAPASPLTPAQHSPAQPSASRTFRNLNPISIPDSGPASLYPSTINVSGLDGVVSGVSLILNNVTHPNPDDLDIMLESPSGRTIIILSDGGGSFAISQSIGFADNGIIILPDDGPINTSPYKPVNYDGGDPDNFPAPAQPPPHGDPARGETFGLAFRGENPTGTWKLYVVDDTAGNSGAIEGGWSLTVGTLEHVVTSLDDSGQGTLRDMIANAPNGAVITFDASLSGSTITLTSGEIVIADKSLTIAGPGTDKLTISGNGTSRIFNITGDPLFRNVSISGLTIANGNGANVASDGSVEDIRISANASLNGLSISGVNIDIVDNGRLEMHEVDADGSGNLSFSCLNLNSTNPVGGLLVDSTDLEGYIFHTINGNANVSNSTISNGSVEIEGGNANFTNSTFSRSPIRVSVGPDGTTVTFDSCTIADHVSQDGSGALNIEEGANVTVKNTIFDQSFLPDIIGQINSQGFNIIRNPTGGSGFVGTDLLGFSSNLTRLQDNGGPTPTYAPRTGSPASNTGSTSLLDDQRFYNRLTLSGIYRGAVEADPREGDSNLTRLNLGFRNVNELFAKYLLTAANQEATPLIGEIKFRFADITNTYRTDSNGIATAVIPISTNPAESLQKMNIEYPGSPRYHGSFAGFRLKQGLLFRPPDSSTPGGAGCQSLIFDADGSFAANGGSGTINVRTFPFDCNWTATSNDSWIQITSGNNGSGDGSVTYTVSSHTGTAPRAGSITVAGITYDVFQGAAFLDVPESNPFYTFIGKLSARGVTQGCGGGNYCPTQTVTREQMAAFIIRALGDFNPPPPAMQRFADVPPENPFYAFIEQMAVRQITLGCGGGNYCPASPVLREQMAAFLIRGVGEPSPTEPFEQRFTDVPLTNIFSAFIEEMAIRRITLGCGANIYCPTQSVTREQMAAFLVRAFGL